MILAKGSQARIFDPKKFVDELLGKNEIDKLIFIVPTNRKVRALRKELITSAPGKLLTKFYVETLYTVAQKIFKPDEKKYLINEATAIVLLRQSFREIELRYFKNYKQSIPHGTLLKLHYVISEYKRNGVTPDILQNEIDNLTGIDRDKALDIAALFEKYNSKLNTLYLFEIGDIYSEILKFNKKMFDNSFAQSFGKPNYLFVDGFTELSNPEIKLIDRISCTKNMDTFIKFDHDEKNKNLFSSVYEMREKFLEKGFKELNELYYSNTQFEQELKRNLFNHKNRGRVTNNKIKIISAASREAEVSTIASEIKNMLTEEGVQPHKICVAANLISNYSNIIRDRFSVFGIPFNLTDRYSLNTFQSVLYFINLLEIAENNFYYKNINRYLTTSLDENERSLFLDFQIVAAEAKVTAGFKNWIEALNLIIGSERFGNDNDSNKLYKSSERVLNFLQNINKKLHPFKKQLTPNDFLTQFEKIYVSSKVASAVLSTKISERELQVKAVISFIDTVREIISLLEIEYSKTQTFSLGFYINTIKTAINSTRFNVKEKSNYGVLVTTIEEIRGLNFDHLFICGLCDGDFPTRYAPEIFVHNKFIRGEAKHLNEEQLLFYQALKTAQEKIYLSFPAGEAKKEFSESIFIKEIKEHFDFEEFDSSKFKDIIYSQDGLSTFLGKNYKNIELEKIEDQTIKQLLKKIEADLKKDDERNSGIDIKSVYKGFLLDENLLFEEVIYSITQLESYARCPYKYFLERVIRATTIEKPTDEIQPLELGSLLHNILFDFYSVILKEGKSIHNCSDADFKKISELLFKLAEENISKLNFYSSISFFEVEKIIGIDGRKERSILSKFLEEERMNGAFTPKFLEIAFGTMLNSEQKTFLTDFEIEGIKLRGRIDRIDLDETEKSFKVIDYKVGTNIPTKDELLGGLSLQIPVYVTAARKLIQEVFGDEYKAIIPAIYSLKYIEKKFGIKPVLHIDTKKIQNANSDEIDSVIQEMEKIAAEKITDFVAKIRQGEFPLSSLPNREEKVCKYCNYSSVCRVKENEHSE